MRFGFLNNFAAQLATPVTDDATEIELSTGAEAIATALEDADAVALTLFVVDTQGNETKREVVYATAVAESVVTIEREKEGTERQGFSAGDRVEARLTAAPLQQMLQGIAGTMPTGTAGAIALGSAYEHEDQTVGPSQAVAPGALALGSESYATSDAAVAIGGRMYAALESGGDLVLVSAAQANGVGAVAIGPGAQANRGLSLAVGNGAVASAVRATAIAGGSAHEEGAVAIGSQSQSYGENAFAAGGGQAYGDNSFSFGVGSYSSSHNTITFLGGQAYGLFSIAMGDGSYTGGEKSFALGGKCYGTYAIAIGDESTATAPHSIALGKNAGAQSEESIAIGFETSAAPPQAISLGAGSSCSAPETVAVGAGAKAQPPYSIALGRSATTTITGGLQVNALSYLPLAYEPEGVNAGPPPTATRQSAMQVVIATEVMSLIDDNATATLELPSSSMLFIDAFDLVIIDADSAGGAPEIQIGPDDTAPADYLAATIVSKASIGGRETFEPLISDGVTALRVSVATAGTGALSAKVVVRGYVMEI
ncbi:hypothetical protein [Vreelandella sp. H-I2]